MYKNNNISSRRNDYETILLTRGTSHVVTSLDSDANQLNQQYGHMLLYKALYVHSCHSFSILNWTEVLIRVGVHRIMWNSGTHSHSYLWCCGFTVSHWAVISLQRRLLLAQWAFYQHLDKDKHTLEYTPANTLTEMSIHKHTYTHSIDRL